MRQLTPSPRLHSLYRYTSTRTLRRRSARILRTPGGADSFPATLSRITGEFLSHRTATAFEATITRSLSTLSTSTAHLFSLAKDDASHLCVLAEQALALGMAVHLHIPREADVNNLRLRAGRCRFASLEVI